VTRVLPVIGRWIGAMPAVAVALLTDPVQALMVLVFFVAFDQIDAHLVLPNLMRQQTDIPPLLVIFALLAGGFVGGVLGAMVAIPIAGALRVLVLREVAPAVRRWTGAEPVPA
jgi:predicted PurR-regulated permease PerM